MEIEEKYIKLLGKSVYSKNLNKCGHISSLELVHGLGSWIQFNVFYDTFDAHHILFFNDFLEGKVQFVIIHGYDIVDGEPYCDEEIEDIKFSMGEKFCPEMIIHMTDKEWKKNVREKDISNVQKLHTDLVSLTDVSAEVMSNDFYSRELYLKWKGGVLSETEFLYALVNHLCQEYDRINERNMKYFFKYEF